ncbi:MAG: hypothetical protein J6V72_10545 [Kiritimatiellae bacterium]|nr:hypothetical protein [Kiritimatiellia bacterium]
MKAIPLVLACSCAAISAAVPPSPSRAELEAAEDGVREVVQDVLDDLHDGKLTRAEAAEEVRIRASHAESAAEYLLLQGAFRLFMRAGEYPRAADLLRHMHAREFPPEALASLAEQALEPVPRGVSVAGLDGLLASLHDEIAHVRKRTAEHELGEAFDRLRLPDFSSVPDGTVLGVAERVRACVLEQGGSRFNVYLQTASDDGGIPVLPPLQLTNQTLRALFDAVCEAGGWTRRIHGRALLLTRNPGTSTDHTGEIRSPGNAEETARKLKECRLGFVAFDASETLPEAAERLFLAVSDRARAGFDVVVLTPPKGKPSPLRTVRAADITLYDALGLLCDAADYRFEIPGDWVVLKRRDAASPSDGANVP